MFTVPWKARPTRAAARWVPHATLPRVLGTLARAGQVGQHVLMLASSPQQDLLCAMKLDERRCHALGAVMAGTTLETLEQMLTEVLEWVPAHGHPAGTLLLAADDLPRVHMGHLLRWTERLGAAGVQLLIVPTQ